MCSDVLCFLMTVTRKYKGLCDSTGLPDLIHSCLVKSWGSSKCESQNLARAEKQSVFCPSPYCHLRAFAFVFVTSPHLYFFQLLPRLFSNSETPFFFSFCYLSTISSFSSFYSKLFSPLNCSHPGWWETV